LSCFDFTLKFDLMIFQREVLDDLADDLLLRAKMPASWGIVIMILLVYRWTQGEVVSGNGDAWYECLGLSREGMSDGGYWQIFSHGLLHGSWAHLSVNAVLIWLLGTRMERMLGWRAMLGVTCLGMIAGGLMHLLLGHGLLVGISGGVMALLLCLATLSPDARVLPLGISAKNLGRGILVGELILTLADPALGIPIISSIGAMLVDHGYASVFQLGHACHLGGGLMGVIIAQRWRAPRLTLEMLRLQREMRECDSKR
jgi:membrane associated rhomboid family serine protease